jgi:hypothetical protein
MNAKPIQDPANGIEPNANDTITEVIIMTARYADVASMVSMPL